ncbi:MAG: hypothetical protein OXQ94_13055 [Gemmatimonadota bacterium]|nr:hypothetical protein [Gemmatimonadota bacterium]MDE2872601.1 hypothetical protein [Gemmatimonadota bacterium]
MSDEVERGLPARMWGVVALKSAVFGEIAEDRKALAQAVVVVLLASLAAGTQDYGLGWGAMAWVAAVSVLQWLFWVLVSYEVGCDLLGGEATLAALLRTLGFARAPGILMVLGPVVGGIHFLAHAWTLLAGVVAIRAACGFGTVRAVITAMCGIVPYWLLNFLVLN